MQSKHAVTRKKKTKRFLLYAYESVLPPTKTPERCSPVKKCIFLAKCEEKGVK
jgi:hypothetical protein